MAVGNHGCPAQRSSTAPARAHGSLHRLIYVHAHGLPLYGRCLAFVPMPWKCDRSSLAPPSRTPARASAPHAPHRKSARAREVGQRATLGSQADILQWLICYNNIMITVMLQGVLIRYVGQRSSLGSQTSRRCWCLIRYMICYTK